MPTNQNETQSVQDLDGDTITYINPSLISTEKMSFNLFGQNTSDLATSLNENFIGIVQSFYGEVAPLNPLKGQEWLNATDNLKYIWGGENWVQNTPNVVFDSFLFIKEDITETEFVIDESVFNFTIENIKLFNQEMKDIKFIIDPFDSKKIILKETNVTTLYILIFHPKDQITNPIINKKTELYATSGQTQFDIENFLVGTNINTLSVAINDVMIKNNEFSIVNNILTIDGMIYRVKNNDVITAWKHGGSLNAYYSTLHVSVDKRKDSITIPNFFKSIQTIELVDMDTKTIVNPINVEETEEYFKFELLDEKLISSTVKIRLI